MVNEVERILRPREVEKRHLQTILWSKNKYYGQHGKSKRMYWSLIRIRKFNRQKSQYKKQIQFIYQGQLEKQIFQKGGIFNRIKNNLDLKNVFKGPDEIINL